MIPFSEYELQKITRREICIVYRNYFRCWAFILHLGQTFCFLSLLQRPSSHPASRGLRSQHTTHLTPRIPWLTLTPHNNPPL